MVSFSWAIEPRKVIERRMGKLKIHHRLTYLAHAFLFRCCCFFFSFVFVGPWCLIWIIYTWRSIVNHSERLACGAKEGRDRERWFSCGLFFSLPKWHWCQSISCKTYSVLKIRSGDYALKQVGNEKRMKKKTSKYAKRKKMGVNKITLVSLK